jgi:hypothetical protein
MRILIVLLGIVGAGTVLLSGACNDSIDRAGTTAGELGLSPRPGDAGDMCTRARPGSPSLSENLGPLSVFFDNGRERHCSVLVDYKTPSAESLCWWEQSADRVCHLANQRR